MKKLSFDINKYNRYIESFMILFICLQPIFDLKIFYNSISTLIRVIIFGLFFCFFFLKDKNKNRFKILIYLLILGVYFLLHNWNAGNFYSVVPGNFNYSTINEALYFIKMLVPYFLIYSLLRSSINKENLFTVMKIIVLAMSLVIIISNLFVFSYGSYSDTPIKASFLSWFGNTNQYTYQDLASKGLFEYANQISAVLLGYLPFIIYSTLKEKKMRNIFILLANCFALSLLGTRTAIIGAIIVFAYTIIVFVFFAKKVDKEGLNKKMLAGTLAVLLIYLALVPANPMFKRISEMTNISQDSNTISVTQENEQVIAENTPLTEEQNPLEYIKANYQEKEIHEQFILASYPYQYDPDFWLNIMQHDRASRTNYRYIEQEMVKRVVSINNNKYDMFLGITNTRLQNIFNIEKDFVVQYYAIRNNRAGYSVCSIFTAAYILYI